MSLEYIWIWLYVKICRRCFHLWEIQICRKRSEQVLDQERRGTIWKENNFNRKLSLKILLIKKGSNNCLWRRAHSSGDRKVSIYLKKRTDYVFSFFFWYKTSWYSLKNAITTPFSSISAAGSSHLAVTSGGNWDWATITMWSNQAVLRFELQI